MHNFTLKSKGCLNIKMFSYFYLIECLKIYYLKKIYYKIQSFFIFMYILVLYNQSWPYAVSSKKIILFCTVVRRMCVHVNFLSKKKNL